MGQKSNRPATRGQPIRIGFVPLCDCAPLVMARELGLFEKHGVRAQLSREIGWATLRDKILYGELEAAHALAPMVFSATLGLEAPAVPCLTGLVLNLHGNAVTVSRAVAGKKESAENLLSHRDRFVLGIPFRYSSHHFIARAWLRSLGPAMERRVQFVVVPPPQMPENLRAGHLDGYCVGEPWNSIAALAGFGRIVATSAEIAPLHPEKVLMVRSVFAEQRAEEHERLIAALIEACRFCDARRNREMVIETLARREYLNVPHEAVRAAFGGQFEGGPGESAGNPDFTIFARDNANEPSGKKAAWILENLRDSGLCKDPAALSFSLAKRLFRSDLFERALRRCETSGFSNKNENELQKQSLSTI